VSTDSPAGRHAPVALGGGGAVELAHALVVKVIPVAPWPKTRSAIVSPAPVAPVVAVKTTTG
jgi:alcohol dehydrogenase class IV